MKYTYGTSEAAARRLESIAAFFNPLAVEFIRSYTDRPAAVALDLGCGPGLTTDMLSKALPRSRVYGMDKSAAFLETGRRKYPHLNFVEHDVTETPFPVEAEVMYARFLLSHLKGVVALVNRWAKQLSPRGLLFIEEVEAIDTEVALFQRYLEINAALIHSQGGELFVGRTLAEASYEHDLLLNEAITLPVENWQAASWFFPNTVTIWQEEEHVLNNVHASERKEISDELARITDSGDSRKDITWLMRHLVLRRAR